MLRVSKHLLGISIVLALALPAPAANALTTRSISVSESGDISADSGRVVVTGSSSASAEVRTILRSGSTDGSADVRIETESDGVRRIETRQYDIPSEREVETRSAGDAARTQANARAGEAAEATSSAEVAPSFLITSVDRFVASISRFLSFVFFFWQ